LYEETCKKKKSEEEKLKQLFLYIAETVQKTKLVPNLIFGNQKFSCDGEIESVWTKKR
jgi:hypothetical protein